jgi:hypothetical protein
VYFSVVTHELVTPVYDVTYGELMAYKVFHGFSIAFKMRKLALSLV